MIFCHTDEHRKTQNNYQSLFTKKTATIKCSHQTKHNKQRETAELATTKCHYEHLKKPIEKAFITKCLKDLIRHIYLIQYYL